MAEVTDVSPGSLDSGFVLHPAQRAVGEIN